MEKIFKWLTGESGDAKSMSYCYWFSKNFKPYDFKGIDRLLFCFIEYCSFLSIVPKKQFLDSYLRVDAKTDIKKYSIRTDSMDAYDYKQASQLEEAYRLLCAIAGTTYDSYVAVSLDGRDFKVDMYDYMSELKASSIQDAFLTYYPKLTDGSNLTEVSMELRTKLALIDETFDTKKIANIDLVTRNNSNTENKFVCKTGLPCVDGDLGGIYTGLIVTLNAQPGGGKTRMSLVHFAYPVLTIAKKDVLYIETELRQSQVENILIAYHIIVMFGGKYKIPDSVMNKKEEMSEEQKRIYEAARIDLFESGKYGKFIFKQGAIVEELEEELTNDLRMDPDIALICIDYMGLIDSRPLDKRARRLEQYEIITEAYKIVRNVLLYAQVSAVCLNQYNDKGIDAAYAGKHIRPGYVQGGHIVQRHTDYDLSITFTEEQELAGVMAMSTTKRRASAGFNNVIFQTDKSVSIFKQIASNSV